MHKERNRAGTCDFCGTELGWYWSKWVEKKEPFRIMCTYSTGCDKKHLDEVDGHVDFDKWWYYTDG